MRDGINPLPSLIRASAQDAGFRSMRAGNRSVWSEEDYDAAVREQDRLVGSLYGDGITGAMRFQRASQLERDGLLTLGMTAAQFTAAIDKVAGGAP